jgi:threonine dehydrogenase-like Zn-dependent dehydrogenase
VPKRKELARHYGADVIVDFNQREPVEAIMEITGNVGVDASIESLGSQKTLSDCIKVTRPGGTISNIGYHGEGDSVLIPRMEWGVGMGDKTIKTGLCPGGKERMQRLLRLIENQRVDPTPMTTHTFQFDELDRAFEMMKTKEDDIIKPLIVFDG